MLKPRYNQIYKEIRDALYNLYPVCEAYLDENFALGDVLVKYRYVENHEDFYKKLREGYIQIAASGNPLTFEKIDCLDDRMCLRKRVFGSNNNFAKGYTILKMGDSTDNLILLNIRRRTGRR